MIEQFIYDSILADTALSTLLSDGAGGLLLYPSVVPRDVSVGKAVTFTLISTNDRYPAVSSVNVQFNIFTETHIAGAQIAQAIANIFNGDHNKKVAGVSVVSSIRRSESDLGYNYDDKVYQRETSYYFKIR